MDAQHSGDDRCQQHLQRDRNPADEQTHGDTASNRTPVEMPDHRLGKGIACPAAQGIGMCFRTTELQVQLAPQRMRVRQPISQPVTGHDPVPRMVVDPLCRQQYVLLLQVIFVPVCVLPVVC